MCPCIANIIPNYSQQDATFLDLFISTDAVHVSGGSSTHHQEHTTVHTASGIVNQYFVIDDHATFWFIYSYPISSTCFGRSFRPSSGALDCIYSF